MMDDAMVGRSSEAKIDGDSNNAESVRSTLQHEQASNSNRKAKRDPEYPCKLRQTHTAPTCDTRDVHDVPLGLDEVGDDLLGEDEGGRRVDGHAALVVLQAEVGGGAAHQDTGRVDQNVKGYWWNVGYIKFLYVRTYKM